VTELFLNTSDDVTHAWYFLVYRLSFFIFLPAQQFVSRAIDILGLHSPGLHYEHSANFVTHANYYFTLRSLFDSLSWEMLILSMLIHGAGEVYMFLFRASPMWFSRYHRLWQSGPWRAIYRYDGDSEEEARHRYLRWLYIEYGSRFYLAMVTCFVFMLVSPILFYSWNHNSFLQEKQGVETTVLKLAVAFLWEMSLHVIIQVLNWRWYGHRVMLPWIEYTYMRKGRVHLWWIGLTVMGYFQSVALFRVIKKDP